MLIFNIHDREFPSVLSLGNISKKHVFRCVAVIVDELAYLSILTIDMYILHRYYKNRKKNPRHIFNLQYLYSQVAPSVLQLGNFSV